ncbi:hypothetical protein [Streptomyces nodosus]|uniref:hypothetical protein n=1 Tax=Streptomyces nodosus TaxID=40318 RepID=UPI0036E96AB8
MMRNRVGALLTAAVAVSGLLLVGWPVVHFLTTYGCGEDEERLADLMTGAAGALDTAPEGTGLKKRYRECDDDDRRVVVGTHYRYDGSPTSALAHYRKAAGAAGWQPRTTAGGGTVPGCFTKPVGGTTAYLGVEGPDDGLLHVEIIADRAGSQWC